MLSAEDQETICCLKEQSAVASKSDEDPSDYQWPWVLYFDLKNGPC